MSPEVLVVFRHVFRTEYHRNRPILDGPEKRKRQISHGLGEFVLQNRTSWVPQVCFGAVQTLCVVAHRTLRYIANAPMSAT